MQTKVKELTTAWRVDAEALFKRLGLMPAEPTPIIEGFREANRTWRQMHKERIDLHARRIADETSKLEPEPQPDAQSRATKCHRRRVWCIELRREFASLSDAARFVNCKASNIHQSIRTGCFCRTYHWEYHDAGSHSADALTAHRQTSELPIQSRHEPLR